MFRHMGTLRVAPQRLALAVAVAVAILGVATVGPTTISGLRTQASATEDPKLTVQRSGNGVVSSQPAGISCGEDCDQRYKAATVVELFATPAANERFLGWSGACQGDGRCVVSMDGDRAVQASFTGQTPTPSPSPSPSPSASPSPTPTASPSPMPTATPTPTPSAAATATPTPSATPSPSPQGSLLRSISISALQSVKKGDGALRLRLACTKPCIVRASGTLTTRGGTRYGLSIVRRTLPGNTAATLRLKLGRRARAAVRRTATRGRPAIASLRITATPQDGGDRKSVV